MNNQQIFNGIFKATTKEELTQFLDKFEICNIRGECHYDSLEWAEISLFVQRNHKALIERVLH